MARAFVLICVLGFSGCTTTTAVDPGICTNAPQILHPGADLHGHDCTSGATCMYGVCTKSAMQLGGTAAFGVCTKDCSCGAHSACSDEDDEAAGLHFTCIRAAKGPGAECAIYCKTLSDCQKINPQFTTCTSEVKGVFVSGVKVCAMTK